MWKHTNILFLSDRPKPSWFRESAIELIGCGLLVCVTLLSVGSGWMLSIQEMSTESWLTTHIPTLMDLLSFYPCLSIWRNEKHLEGRISFHDYELLHSAGPWKQTQQLSLKLSLRCLAVSKRKTSIQMEQTKSWVTSHLIHRRPSQHPVHAFTDRSQFLYRRKQVGDLKQNDRTVRFDSFSLVIHLLLIKPMHFIFNTQDTPFKRKWGHLTSVPWKPSTFLTDDRKSGSLTGNGHDNGKEMTRVPGSCADKGSLSSKLGQSKKCHLWQKASKDFFTFIFKHLYRKS